MAEQAERGFVFPDDPAGYSRYYVLHVLNDKIAARTILRERRAPYYHSRAHPSYILVNVDRFPGNKTDEIGLERVNIGMKNLWEIARAFKDVFDKVELYPDEDDCDQIAEASVVENLFYDDWTRGKYDEAIAAIDDSGIDVDSVSFLFKPPCIITVHPGGLFVVSGMMDRAPDHVDAIIGEIARLRNPG